MTKLWSFVIRWCVESFKWILIQYGEWCVESFKWIMVNCQNNTVTTQKVLESYIGEILESLQNHKDVWMLLQTNFFHQRQQLRSFVQSFKLFCWTFETFKNLGTKKKVSKMLESHAISSNLSVVHHKWPKVSFLMKRQWFDDAWKVSNEFDSIWWIAKTIQLPQRRSLKAI